jgi:hypothetical protein
MVTAVGLIVLGVVAVLFLASYIDQDDEMERTEVPPLSRRKKDR